MNTYGFTAYVLGLDMDSDEQLTQISELDFDASAEARDGNDMVAMSVEDTNPIVAIRRSTIGLASCGLSILRFDLDLINLSEIALRTNTSRETARLWATGKRRAAFPSPYTSAGNSSLWAWSDVFYWLQRNDIPVDDLYFETPVSTDLLVRYNGNFARRRQSESAWGSPARKIVAHKDWGQRPAIRRVESPWSELRLAEAR